MRRFIVQSTAALTATPAEAIRIAAIAALLDRRVRTPMLAVMPEASPLSASETTDLTFVTPTELASAIPGAELFCISFAQTTDPARFERAADQAAMAHAAGVPVAWIAAQVAEGADSAALRWLAQVESVSAADAESARRLTALRGRAVEVTAMPELVLDVESTVAPAGRGRVALDAALLDALDPQSQDAMRAALRAFAPRTLVILGESRRAHALCDIARCESVATTLGAWTRAIASCELVVTADGASTAATALAFGTIPVVAGSTSALLSRIALEDCGVGECGDAASWARAFAAASRMSRGLASRVAPLRALAWRSLGQLADATVARPFCISDAESRARLARACVVLAAPAAARGDGVACGRILDAVGVAVESEREWVVARARADALLGRDRDAVLRLEAAIDRTPGDPIVIEALARARTREGDFTGAVATWEQLARVAPSSPQPWHEIAQLSLASGRVAPALEAFARAQACEPGHDASAAAIHALLATDPEREAEFWRRLCEAHPGNAVLRGRQLEVEARRRPVSAAGSTAVAAGPPTGV